MSDPIDSDMPPETVRDTLPAPSDEEVTGIHHEIPGFVGEPPPADMEGFPRETSAVNIRLDAFSATVQTLGEVVYTLETALAGISALGPELRAAVDHLREDAQSLRTSVEERFVTLENRVKRLERRFDERFL